MTFIVRHHLRFLDAAGIAYSAGYCDAVRAKGRTLEVRLDGAWREAAHLAGAVWRTPDGGQYVAWEAPLVASEVVS